METMDNSRWNDWKRFEGSGRVEDYLRYVGSGAYGEADAGICNSNGNYTQADACG